MIPTIMLTKAIRDARKPRTPRNPIPTLKAPRVPGLPKLRLPGWLTGFLKSEAAELPKPFDADSDDPADWCAAGECVCEFNCKP